MGEIDDLESIADLFDREKDARALTPKGRASRRAAARCILDHQHAMQRHPMKRLKMSAAARRRYGYVPITLAPIRGGAS